MSLDRSVRELTHAIYCYIWLDRSDPRNPAPKREIPLSSPDHFATLSKTLEATADLRADPSTRRLMLNSSFDAFEGEFETGSMLRIGMPVGASVTAFHRNAEGRFEGIWRPGQVLVAPPFSRIQSRTSPMRMIGLAIDLGEPGILDAQLLRALAQIGIERVFDDPLISAALTTLWYEAETHGLSTAFFDHGVSLVIHRLCEIAPLPDTRTKGLSKAEMVRIAEFIEDRLAFTISVNELAALIRRDPSGFTRAFRETTGTTPFRYLTERRMDRAAQLLQAGYRVSQAAEQVGYANASKFAAAFVRVRGTTPSDYKRIP